MNSYRIRTWSAAPMISMWEARPALDARMIGESLAEVVVRELTQNKDGSWTLDLQLNRSSHAEALDEIMALVAQAGFQWAEIEVTEWATKWVEGLLLGGGGGALLGGTTDTLTGLLAGLVGGAIAGLGVALVRPTVARILDAERNQFVQGGWQLTPKPPSTPVREPLVWSPEIVR